MCSLLKFKTTRVPVLFDRPFFTIFFYFLPNSIGGYSKQILVTDTPSGSNVLKKHSKVYRCNLTRFIVHIYVCRKLFFEPK